MSGTLDEISLKLGELAAYTHEHRHGVANLSAKLDGLGVDVAKQIAVLEARMTARIDDIHQNHGERLAALEAERNRRDGASSIIALILKSPAVGWLVGVAGAAWAVLSGKLQL